MDDSSLKSGRSRGRPSQYEEGGPARREIMFMAARLYYESRKLKRMECPACRRFLPTLRERVARRCPLCRADWAVTELTRLTQEDVAALLESPTFAPSRSEIQRLIGEAQDDGILQIHVLRAQEDHELADCRDELLSVFPGLLEARVVKGREDLFDLDALKAHTAESIRPVRNAVLVPAARAAAELILGILHKHLEEGKEPTLCISWGYVVHLIADALRPAEAMPAVTVAPFVGALTAHPFEANVYDSNLLAQQVSEQFHSEERALWLASPAFVRHEGERDSLTKCILVQEVLEQIRKAHVVTFSIAPADEDNSTLVERGLLKREDVLLVKRNGAIGEIAGHFFDQNGRPVSGVYPIGLGLDPLRDLVSNRRAVVTLVAADRRRVEPLRAAIRGGLVNILVTDHLTAKTLVTQA